MRWRFDLNDCLHAESISQAEFESHGEPGIYIMHDPMESRFRPMRVPKKTGLEAIPLNQDNSIASSIRARARARSIRP